MSVRQWTLHESERTGEGRSAARERDRFLTSMSVARLAANRTERFAPDECALSDEWSTIDVLTDSMLDLSGDFGGVGR